MTRRCPISYTGLAEGMRYSPEGLRKLSPQLRDLHDLPFTTTELRQEAVARADKLSIQGVQIKLSARLSVEKSRFVLVEKKGLYILKPQSVDYPSLPENEDVTMRMAAAIGITVPLHGMVYGKDGAMTYFIRRFDREGRSNKLAVEDFAQLSGQSRDTKYSATMESLIKVIDTHCTFPVLQRRELFVRTLFSFLVGNEDMHLKNFSTRTQNGIVALAPAYDFLNTSIVLKHAKEELALPLNGKKNRLKRHDLIDYFAYERLGLNEAVVREILDRVRRALPQWRQLLQGSFLPDDLRHKYNALLADRLTTMDLG